MGFDFNNIPKEKPSNFGELKLEDGLHTATIEKVEYKQSTKGSWMLSIQMKAENGKFIFDQIMDDQTKPMNAYKLFRLTAALGLKLEGQMELRDFTKVIKAGAKLVVATVTKGDYVNVDINKNEGYYPVNNTATRPEKPTPQPNLQAATDDDSY